MIKKLHMVDISQGFNDNVIKLWLDVYINSGDELKIIGWALDKAFNLPVRKIEVYSCNDFYACNISRDTYVGEPRRLYRSDVARKHKAFCDPLGFEFKFNSKSKYEMRNICMRIISIDGLDYYFRLVNDSDKKNIKRIQRKLCSII